MPGISAIEWTDATWNPVTGCTKVSPGCKYCYAEVLARRLKAMGNPRYVHGFSVTLHEDLIDIPKKWRRPRRIFVNSMSDLFHEDIPKEFITRVFASMCDSPQHTYQILTKRPDRLLELSHDLPVRDFIWLGTSVENSRYKHRIEILRKVDTPTRFLSLEPLIGDLGELDLTGIHWVIAGGESGPRSRPMNPDWVRGIRRQCETQGVPFFFKQWGGRNKKAAGRTLDGETFNNYPLAAAAE